MNKLRCASYWGSLVLSDWTTVIPGHPAPVVFHSLDTQYFPSLSHAYYHMYGVIRPLCPFAREPVRALVSLLSFTSPHWTFIHSQYL
jgi:hypothetical protein